MRVTFGVEVGVGSSSLSLSLSLSLSRVCKSMSVISEVENEM